MSNRMKVVELLLGDTFANYQKIILTHDYGFFREFQRKIAHAQSDWSMISLQGSPETSITISDEKTALQKAEDYLNEHDLDAAAQSLRQACEDTVNHYLTGNKVIAKKEFKSLTLNLQGAKNKILKDIPRKLYQKILTGTAPEHLPKLIPNNTDDLENDQTLDEPTRNKLIRRRQQLRQMLTTEHVEAFRKAKLIDDILACTERVLNPASHAGDAPLYQKEIEDALALVNQLSTDLNPPERP